MLDISVKFASISNSIDKEQEIPKMIIHKTKPPKICLLLLENDKENKFRIKPDLVICDKADTKLKNPPKIIADTKWKILNFSRNDYGVSQSDLYQVFAYLSRYQCQNGILIYPKIDDENNDLQKLSEQTFTYKAVSNLKNDDNKKPPHTLQIYFFNLDKAQNSQIYPFEDLNSKIFA